MGRLRWDVPRVTADAIVIHEGKLVLIRRKNRPYRGMYAVPGGFVELGEPPEKTVVREVFEETGLRVKAERLLGVYGDPKVNRRPRGHVVSLVYIVRSIGGSLMPGDDAQSIGVFSFDKLPSKLRGYHARVVSDFLNSLQKGEGAGPRGPA